jgi:hypothetical protein
VVVREDSDHLRADGFRSAEVRGHDGERALAVGEAEDLPQREDRVAAREGRKGARHDVDAVAHGEQLRDVCLTQYEDVHGQC